MNTHLSHPIIQIIKKLSSHLHNYYPVSPPQYILTHMVNTVSSYKGIKELLNITLINQILKK